MVELSSESKDPGQIYFLSNFERTYSTNVTAGEASGRCQQLALLLGQPSTLAVLGWPVVNLLPLNNGNETHHIDG